MKAKKYLIFLIILIVIIFVGIYLGEKRPMSGYSFFKTMEKNGYIVINNLRGDGDSILPEKKIERLSADHEPLEAYTAVNDALTTELLYQIFPTDEDAIQLVLMYKNNIKLDVTKEQKVGGYNFKDDENRSSNRNGINYQRTYFKDYNDRYFLISRINNTLLIASIHSDDKMSTNRLFNDIGY